MALTVSSLAVPTMAAGASGTVQVGFGVFSPKMTVTIPTAANLTVNGYYDSDATDLSKFSVSSEAIGIENRTSAMIGGTETGIPLKCKVNATISEVGEGVATYYKTFTPTENSSKKKIALNLQEVSVAYDADTDKEDSTIYTMAALTGSEKSTPITKEGSSLTFAVKEPTIADGIIAADKGGFGGFAIVGDANTDADWTTGDVALELTYDIKPATASFATTTKVAPTLTGGTSTADAVITFTEAQLNDATIEGVFLHNDEIEAYEYADVELEFEVEVNETTATSRDITIAKEEYSDAEAGTAVEAVIVLSDGRTAVVTLPNT